MPSLEAMVVEQFGNYLSHATFGTTGKITVVLEMGEAPGGAWTNLGGSEPQRLVFEPSRECKPLTGVCMFCTRKAEYHVDRSRHYEVCAIHVDSANP